MTTKFIFVTGGVVSSLGKGLAAASIGSLARGARLPGHAAEDGSLHQRGCGDHESVPARRGLRDRRRRRDRPRPRPLRALHLGPDDPGQQRHDREGLRDRDREGAPRRLPGPHRPGDPAHHRRDQGVDPEGGRGRGRGDHRDRGHRRRHRGPAVPRGGAPVQEGRGQGQRHLRPPHAGAVHPGRAGAQDQGDPALGQGAAGHRDPARRAPVPDRQGPSAHAVHQVQDRALLRCRGRGGDRGPRRGHDLRGADRVPRPGPGRVHRQAAGPALPADRSLPLGGDRAPDQGATPPLPHRGRRQVHRGEGFLQEPLRGARPRGHRPRGGGRGRLGGRRAHRARGAGRPRGRARRHPGARRLRGPGHRGEDPGHPVRARAARAVLRHLPRHAVRGHRVRAPRVRARRAPTPPSSIPPPRTT